MKKLNNIEQLEALIKKNLDKAQVTPPPGVWEVVASSAGIGSTSVVSQLTSYFSSVTNLVKVALFAGGLTTAGVLLYQANTAADSEQKSTSTAEVIVEEGLVQDANEALTELPLAVEEISEQQSDERETNTTDLVQEQNDQFEENYRAERLNEQFLDADGQVIVVNDPASQGQDGSVNVPVTDSDRIGISTPFGTTCLGDARTFISNGQKIGDWYINGELVKKSSEVLSHVFNLPGEFRVMLEVGEARVQVVVHVNELLASIVQSEDEQGEIKFSISPSEIEVKRWLVNGQERSTMQVFTAKSMGPGKQMVAAEIADEACPYVVDKEVEIASTPEPEVMTAFSPNGDGENDEYWVTIADYTSFYLVITDLSGAELFKTMDPAVKWNGKVANVGFDVPAGHYIVNVRYQLKGALPKTKTVKLLLKR